MRAPALLALEDGTLFEGEAIGASGARVGEVVFNTAMTGYQEILSDPSYCRQIVTLTTAHVGIVGTNALDDESAAVHAAALVIRDLPAICASWRAEQSLGAYLKEHSVVGIAGIDTRRLTRLLRTGGAQNGCVMAGAELDAEQAVARARGFAGLAGMDLAREVSTDQVYRWGEGDLRRSATGWRYDEAPADSRFRVVAYDFGIKRNILRMLVAHGCEVIVVPAMSTAAEVMARQPDGIFLSNGPGDPEPCVYAIDAIRELLAADLPIFGICLGHQLLALAAGARTVKMKFGHHGANHPVSDLDSGRVIISSQNHGFAVDESTLPDCLRATHRSLFDGSLQGLEHRERPAFGFQGHPEASPGPHDARPLFARFIATLRARASAARQASA